MQKLCALLLLLCVFTYLKSQDVLTQKYLGRLNNLHDHKQISDSDFVYFKARIMPAHHNQLADTVTHKNKVRFNFKFIPVMYLDPVNSNDKPYSVLLLSGHAEIGAIIADRFSINAGSGFEGVPWNLNFLVPAYLAFHVNITEGQYSPYLHANFGYMGMIDRFRASQRILTAYHGAFGFGFNVILGNHTQLSISAEDRIIVTGTEVSEYGRYPKILEQVGIHQCLTFY